MNSGRVTSYPPVDLLPSRSLVLQGPVPPESDFACQQLYFFGGKSCAGGWLTGIPSTAPNSIVPALPLVLLPAIVTIGLLALVRSIQ